MFKIKSSLHTALIMLSMLSGVALIATACPSGDGAIPDDQVMTTTSTPNGEEPQDTVSTTPTDPDDATSMADSDQALFFPIFRPEGDHVAEQVKDVEGLSNTTLLSADALLSDDFLALPQSEGLYFSGPDTRYGENSNYTTGVTAENLKADYEAAFGESPTAAFWAHTYDATIILLNAISAASSIDDDGNLVIDRAGIRQYLDELRNFSGIIGQISCDEYGDCGSQKIAVVHHASTDDIAATKENVVFAFSGEETAATDDAATSESPLGDGSLGVVTVAPGEAVQVRSLQVISGSNAALGLTNQRAVSMAIEDYDSIQGFPIEMGAGLDDLCSADGGQAAAQTIVADESIVGVIGTSCSTAAVAAAPLITEAGITMISPSNTSPALTSDLQGTPGENYHKGYYRTAHNDLFQGEAMARFVYENLGITKAAIIHDGDPYTEGLSTAFADAYRDIGGSVVSVVGIAKGDTNMVTPLTEIAAAFENAS